MPVRRVISPVAACLAALALAPAAAEARPRLVPLAKGSATLAVPAGTVTLTAAVKRCQRGRGLVLRIDGRKLKARLPRAASVRRSWQVEGLAAGTVRWRHRVAGKRAGCPRRLAAARLLFSPVEPVAERVARAPAPAQVEPAPVAGGPVAFGTALNWAALQQDEAYASNTSRFASWTPENEMKMEALVPRRDLLGTPQYDFVTADAIVNRAAAEGRQVHGHVLVFKNQVPEWLRNANLPAEKLRAFLHDYIHTVVGRYKGRIRSWDVVNEPLDENGRFDDTTFWASRLGPSYVADAFRWAREADPSATLYLNEVLDVGGPMADGAAGLIADLRAQGVPVDGVGLQTHVEASQSVLTEAAFQQTYERFAALGVKVAVSEMDVALSSPLDEPRQAEVFANAATACARVPACERFTIWGVSDRYSWLGAQKMGLPIDGDYRLKPGWAAIAGALAARR